MPRVLFIAPGLEPGKTGVGDYTRTLAQGVAGEEGSSAMIGLHDSGVVESRVVLETGGVLSQRLPAQMPWSEREVRARKYIEEAAPEWISLQIVTYGFHPKGLLFTLPQRMQTLCVGARVQIMFHELWLLGGGWRARIYGALQRGIIRRLVRRLRPEVIHTHATYYRRLLEREQWRVHPLPLCSSMPIEAPFGPGEFAAWLRQASGYAGAEGRMVFAFFGSLHPEWNWQPLWRKLREHLARTGQRGLLLAMGELGDRGRAIWQEIEREADQNLQCVNAGHLPAADVSRCLQASDYGLSAMPPDLIDKSSTAATMWAHGLPVLASRPPLCGAGLLPAVEACHPLLLTGAKLDRFWEVRRQEPDRTERARMVAQFLSNLAAPAGVDSVTTDQG